MTWTDAWRATIHTLAGVPAGVVSFVFTAGLPIGAGYCAAWSLLYAPGSDGMLTTLFVVLTVIVPVPLWWTVRRLSALQRRRFRLLLGVAIPPGRDGARGTWRQLAYHALALVTGVLGGAAVATLLLAMPLEIAGAWEDGRPFPVSLMLGALTLLAAPWVARALARADTAAARALLGPSRSDTLSARVESLSRSRADIVAATDAERRRIERDLHDGAQQRLVALAMNLGMARAALGDAADPARQAIAAAHDEATEALAELREFVRGLHPAVLDSRGLDAALSGIAARAPLPVRVRVTATDRCSPVIEAIAYFVVSEALTNVAKHAGASHAEVTVDRAGDRLRVAVSDDGRGGADPGGGGLRGLAQRAASVDGTFALHSPPGGPTTITVELPCAS
ncbi:histidine kinase [Actinoplanes ianthinogenes]|uniref:histidine kinase n=1 Tax=Actinoplanes ianthinogenes TaxID=122358 RepID=A0ABM7LJG3_9ACTN|nr:histidine kinase [Actinoplanes ianthinogenes]BCJ39394.1 histidine kinase [Actinoplanes ianthinogenes]GGR36435.1 histidine kinase [Actinoplanes ianthinogenes]